MTNPNPPPPWRQRSGARGLPAPRTSDFCHFSLALTSETITQAAPRDRIWGVGFGAANAPANRERWGLNLLGKALMHARDRIRAEGSTAET